MWLTQCGLLNDNAVADKILYGLRYADAKVKHLSGTDMHKLVREMCNNVSILEQHYSQVDGETGGREVGWIG